jgi:hypothetical protein
MTHEQIQRRIIAALVERVMALEEWREKIQQETHVPRNSLDDVDEIILIP